LKIGVHIFSTKTFPNKVIFFMLSLYFYVDFTQVSCEENGTRGQCHEVDPYGVRKAQETVLGGSGGNFEAVAVDNRASERPVFYVTHDSEDGELRRFTPDPIEMEKARQSGDFWPVLSTIGEMKYLVLEPDNGDNTEGTFKWTTSLSEGRKSADSYHSYAEGIVFINSSLYFVCKQDRFMFTLNMQTGRFQRSSTMAQMFGGSPDQIIVPSSSSSTRGNSSTHSNIMYFTEDPDDDNKDQKGGIHGMDLNTQKRFTLIESEREIGETAGMAFSPDGRFLLFAYQHEGTLFVAEREDGLPFLGNAMNLKYHQNSIETDIVRHLVGKGELAH
jgi:hypothetical protein